MDEGISDEIGPLASRKAAVPEPEVNKHVRVTTLDEVGGLERERLITPEEEQAPLEQRVPSYHLQNQGPLASEQQVSTTLFEERVPTTLEQQLPTSFEQPPHPPVKEQVSHPLNSKLPYPLSSSKTTRETFGAGRQW